MVYGDKMENHKNKEHKDGTKRDIKKLITYFEDISKTHEDEGSLKIEGYYENLTSKYGVSYLLFEEGTNTAWSVSGYSAKQLYAEIHAKSIISPQIFTIKFEKAYSEKYDTDFIILNTVEV